MSGRLDDGEEVSGTGRVAGRKRPKQQASVDMDDDDDSLGGRPVKRGKRGSSASAAAAAAAKAESERASKGLRHFSHKVCEKVQQKGRTTYNEVADELVQEFLVEGETSNSDKNIRRRVYDALNVLMAMNIIVKEKKEIRWKGLPSSYQQEQEQLHRTKLLTLERIKQKQELLESLKFQQDALERLADRNSRRPVSADAGKRIYLPFILITTKKHSKIQCDMTKNRSEIAFTFAEPFEILDDQQVLRRMGLSGALAAVGGSSSGVASGSSSFAGSSSVVSAMSPASAMSQQSGVAYTTPQMSMAPSVASPAGLMSTNSSLPFSTPSTPVHHGGSPAIISPYIQQGMMGGASAVSTGGLPPPPPPPPPAS